MSKIWKWSHRKSSVPPVPSPMMMTSGETVITAEGEWQEVRDPLLAIKVPRQWLSGRISASDTVATGQTHQVDSTEGPPSCFIILFPGSGSSWGSSAKLPHRVSSEAAIRQPPWLGHPGSSFTHVFSCWASWDCWLENLHVAFPDTLASSQRGGQIPRSTCPKEESLMEAAPPGILRCRRHTASASYYLSEASHNG